MSDYLSLDVITIILSRLPVKSLLRSRCVSKPWYSLIDSQEFKKLHLKNSIETTSNFYLIAYGPDYQLYSIEFATLDKANKIKNPFGECILLGSCKGILLLADLGLGHEGNRKMALFNPATKTHQVLPSPPLPNSGSLDKSYRESFGFGCDSVKNDFKVVSIMKSDSFCETRIFSLKKNSWEKIKDFPYALPNKRVWGVQVKGALHTVVDQGPDASARKLIVALDLAVEDYWSMEIPDDVICSKKVRFVLVKLGEYLSLSVCSGITTDIWVMKEYGVVRSWTKLLSVEMGVNLSTLGFSKAGDKVLLHLGHGKFVWYDLQSKSLFYVPVSGLPQYFNCNLCVENLLRLEESTKDQDGQENMTDKERDDMLKAEFILNL